MIHRVHEIAVEVIRQTGRDKPADAALREVLKQIKDFAPFDATEIARTVFIYYRWHVWLRDECGYQPHCDFTGFGQPATFRLADSMPASRRGEGEHF